MSQSSNETSELAAPGPHTPERALWRTILSGDASTPFMHLTEAVNLMHPGQSHTLDRPELNRKHPNEVNYQVGLWAVYSLGDDNPDARQSAADALAAVISDEDLDQARRWVIYQASMFAFLCAFSPAERVRELARRYATAVQAIEIEIAAA